jgi:uncharacterized protein (DUF1800 family)
MRIDTFRPTFSLRCFRRATSLTLCLVVTGGAFLAGLEPFASADTKASKGRKLSEEQRIVHVLNRIGFGVRPGDVERVRSMGLENYINEQLAPEKILDAVAENKVKDLVSLTMTTAELYEKYPQPGQLLRQLQARGMLPADLAEARENRVKGGATSMETPKSSEGSEMKQGATQMGSAEANNNSAPQSPANPLINEKYRQIIRDYYQQNGLEQPQKLAAELQASRILRAVYSERQLQEVMVDFWTNHFNVFIGKGADRWLLPAYDRDTIRPNAMAKFRTLLEATAKSPAMLFYLDNFQSVSPDMRQPRRLEAAQRPRRGINENYARELMELHTLGVDGGYTQKDVQEVARCFTGWTIFAPRGGGAAVNALMGEAGRRNAGTFYFNQRAHDDGEKLVLGQKIPAGGGIKDGLMVLDILARHPSTAKYIATKLVRYFVADNPPASLVNSVATTYSKTDGDIREMLRTIFFSSEFNSPEMYRAKIKRPFELVISAVRTLGADTNGGPGIHQWMQRMGEPLYGHQTPNGYSDTAEAWVNTGGLLERMNFGLALASNRIPGTRVNLTKLAGTADQSHATDKTKILNQFLSSILGGDISKATRETLLKQLDEQVAVSLPAPRAQMAPADETPSQMDGPRAAQRQLARREANISDPVTKVVGLILGTPEFQRQ